MNPSPRAPTFLGAGVSTSTSLVGGTRNHLAFASPGAHELEQMQLILETVPVIREEDKDELLKVMPSFVSSTWEVKRPLRKLLPEVNSEGTAA